MTSSPAFPDISISTERLGLRAYDEADVPSLVEMMDDELITAWTGVPQPYTAADAHEFVARTAPAERAEGRGLVLAVTEFLTQRLVGTVTLQRTDWRIRATEIGYLTAVWARGEGYACEAVLAVCRWLFEEQAFARVELRTAADNTASQQVAQKIGCVSEGCCAAPGWCAPRPGRGTGPRPVPTCWCGVCCRRTWTRTPARGRRRELRRLPVLRRSRRRRRRRQLPAPQRVCAVALTAPRRPPPRRVRVLTPDRFSA